MNTYTLNLQPILKLDDEQFLQLKFERSQQGNLIIMSPTGGETGNRNAELIIEFGLWNRRKQLGQVFDSSTGFKLANDAIRSPDVAWVKQERWNNLSTEEKRKFPNLAPDFVLELRSKTDSLTETQAKLTEYMENGVRLGWLINPLEKQVEIYRPGKVTEVLDDPQQVSGEEVLPEFTLDLSLVWE